MLSHLKRRFGVLAAIAVLGALVPVLASSPVTAAPATTAITALTIDAPALFKACPTEAAIPDAGFDDVDDAAVNCLKYYGIVKGTTDSTYAPTDSVARWAMALYITRALDVANVTLPSGADQGFTDISGKSAEIQLAINQLKQLGITTGVTATTYEPDSNVNRQQMALFIERMLDNLPAGPGGVQEADDSVLKTAAQVTYINSDCAGTWTTATCTGLYNYTDIDAGSTTVDASLAIKELFTLGIHDGVADTTFDPTGDMTRQAMATFMNAALDHSHLRPEGLYLQSSAYTNVGGHSPTLSVSYRDASFDAIADAAVDVHYWTYTTVVGNAQFASTGLCDDAAASGNSITACYIDTLEPATDEYGNMTPASKTTSPFATIYDGTDSYVAWTAAAATTFDNDVHGEAALPNKHSAIDIVAQPALAEWRCSADTPAKASTTTSAVTMKFAATTTITCQGTSGSAATSGAVAQAGGIIRMDRTRVFTTDSSGLQQGGTLEAVATLGVSDAAGTISFTVTGPTDTTGTDVVTDSITLTRALLGTGINMGGGLPTTGNSGFATDAGDSLTFSLVYKDTTAAAGSVSTTQTTSSAVTSSTGNARSVTATVWDQYGDGVAGEVVTFTSLATMPDSLGLVCSAATPTVCTSSVAHGFAVGKVLNVAALGSTAVCEYIAAGDTDGTHPRTALAVADGLSVEAVGSTTTFTLNHTAAAANVSCTTASTSAQPLQLTQYSFAPSSNTRTTGSSGTASFAWTDTTPNSGIDTVTATTTTGPYTSKINFYRTATAASVSAAGTAGATSCAGDDDLLIKVVEHTPASDTFVVEALNCVASGNITDTSPSVAYYKYTYDDNDQYSYGATSSTALGTAASMATWEGATYGLGTKTVLSGGSAYDYTAGVTAPGTIGTYGDIEAITWTTPNTGISIFRQG